MYRRKLQKIIQKAGWYTESELFEKTKWRQKVPKDWAGDKPYQYVVPGMKYTSVMHVPSSKDARLLRMLAKAEPRIAKITGYQLKFVEKSGKNLSNLFSREPPQMKCDRGDCAVCVNSDPRKPSRCQLKSIVYSGVCKECDLKHKSNKLSRHEGLYIGETSRTLGERAKEHRAGLRRLDPSNFMVKHWSNKHHESDSPPEFVFSVVQQHKDTMSRLIHEAIGYRNVLLSTRKPNGGDIKSLD